MRPTLQFVAITVAVAALLHSMNCFAGETVPDTIEQRAKPCIACHGSNGRAGPDGYYPRLAGKPAGYLLNQLIAFRDGMRHNETMAHLLRGMPDRYLSEFAQYFSDQRVAFEAPTALSDTHLLARGRQLALMGDPDRSIPACTACHGQRLLGAEPNVPGLVGLPPGYLNAQLGAWRIGRRRARAPDCMAVVAARLDATDITAVVAWIGSQTPATDGLPDAQTTASPPIDCGDFHQAAEAP